MILREIKAREMQCIIFVQFLIFSSDFCLIQKIYDMHRLLGNFRPLLTILRYYWPFGSFWANIGHFGSFWANIGNIISFWLCCSGLSHHYFSTLLDKIYHFPLFSAGRFVFHLYSLLMKRTEEMCCWRHAPGALHLWEHGLADFSTLALKYFSTFAFHFYLSSTTWAINYILEGMHTWKYGFARSVQLHWNILFVFWQSTILFKACACGSMGLPGPSTD